MKRRTKRRLSTVVGCVLGGVTFTGPMAGEWLNRWQHKRHICGCWDCERYGRTR